MRDLQCAPNQRVQSTPLAASEIVRILESGLVWKAVSIYEAARLTRKTLGGHLNFRAYENKCNYGEQTFVVDTK